MTTQRPQYAKPHLEIPDLVALLFSRGMMIDDRDEAEQVLRTVGYYRLSGYWYPYRQPGTNGPGRADTFIDGTSFDRVVAFTTSTVD